MTRFQPIERYQPSSNKQYQLLPFRFTPLDEDKYVLTNLAGEYHVLADASLRALVGHTLSNTGPDYIELRAKHFLSDESSASAVDLLALKVRSRYRRLSEFTGLHIFVVTLRCEHSCPYCQVSRQNEDHEAFDMSRAIAAIGLDFVFRSPSPNIKIEFQGGEPLLNFELIKYIVEEARCRNTTAGRDLQFVIATNLALITDDILAFCAEHSIHISTSLDGPEDLHNKNRPRPGKNSYQKVIDGIRRVRHTLGREAVSALMTTTDGSLDRVTDIIDQYLALDFAGIFLRPMSPYGFAVRTNAIADYNMDRWMRFYKEGLNYIIALNRAGIAFREFYTTVILTKMLTSEDPGYVDLMSPAGIGIKAVVYNYDGSVYASDEGRMLAEMKDTTFRLGNLNTNSYEEIFLSDALLSPLEESFAGSAPMCVDCAFEPYCGADPVYHHAVQGDVLGRKAESAFCRRNMEIFRFLVAKMKEEPFVESLFLRWANK